MKHGTISDAYEANDRIRARLLNLVSGLTAEEANLPTGKGDWTIAGIVEHIAMAEVGMTQISAKLLKKARELGMEGDGEARISDGFLAALRDAAETKFDAPDIVQPKGEQTIAESLASMKENRARLHELREMFEQYNGAELTFPHPAFGEMTAHDWLALIGGHESRHIDQIEKILNRSSGS